MSLFEQLKNAFAAFDTNGDGHITVNELQKFMTEFGIECDEEQVQEIVDQMDIDKSGSIELCEFLPMWQKMIRNMIRSPTERKQLRSICSDEMADLKAHLAKGSIFGPERQIKDVVLLVVVADEIAPVLAEFSPVQDSELESRLLNLAQAFTCTVRNESADYKLTILQVASSPIYGRHYSGYTQVSAIVGLVAKEIKPDLLVSFGTSGGVGVGKTGHIKIGDALLASGCVYIDRLRTRSKSSHDWGVFGGPVVPTKNMDKDLGLVKALLGSQISYIVTAPQVHLIDTLGIAALDMEAAPEAEIAMQVGLNFVAIKMISNGVYPENASRMEEEYTEHRATVSANGLRTLRAVLLYLAGKTIGDL
jgi:nucleoside phosphorylase